MFRQLLDFVGIDIRRIQFAWVSAAEGAKWAQLVNKVTDEIRDLGPFTNYSIISQLSFPYKELEPGPTEEVNA